MGRYVARRGVGVSFHTSGGVEPLGSIPALDVTGMRLIPPIRREALLTGWRRAPGRRLIFSDS